MHKLPCAYCTDDATGIDEDGEHTCGDCMAVVAPLPAVLEVSSEDTEEEGDEESEAHTPEDDDE